MVKGVKMHKPLSIKEVSHEEVTYSMATPVDNTVFST